MNTGNSLILQYTPLRTLSIFTCWKRFPFLIFKNKVLCASADDKAGICHGDAGGALLATGTKELVGISSLFNAEGCDDGRPQGFTRISGYLKWIEKTTGISCGY